MITQRRKAELHNFAANAVIVGIIFFWIWVGLAASPTARPKTVPLVEDKNAKIENVTCECSCSRKDDK